MPGVKSPWQQKGCGGQNETLMPITTAIRIIITLAEEMDRPVPPASYMMVSQTVHLWALPSAGSRAFGLRVSEGGSARESQLSTAQSEHLATLLAHLPSHSMVAPGRSLDGITVELVMMRAEETLSFGWQNDDWRYVSQSPSTSGNEWPRWPIMR
jgi:hypothetical protein